MKNDKTPLAKLPLLPVLLCVITLLGAACASEEPAQQVASAGTDRECRTTGSSGSKMRRSVCRSAAEWAEVDRQARIDKTVRDDFFRRARESGALGASPTSSSPTAGGL